MMGYMAGRPSKGKRDSGILAKPPVEFGVILRENARRLGMSYGDYLVALAAERLNMPEFAPRPQDHTSELDLFPKEVVHRAA
jgi:hypothetical protein